MFYIYAISSLKRYYIYVGITEDLKNRLGRHNKGREKTTKPYAPFEMLCFEKVNTRIEARIREKYWKSGTGKEKLKELRDIKK